MFQSRNRDAFLFKNTAVHCRTQIGYLWFQSRNRDAFLFKVLSYSRREQGHQPRFNLVIEMLFFSSAHPMQFIRHFGICQGFNLVIEMLFFSRAASERYRLSWIPVFRFNLVIEMLFFSRMSVWSPRVLKLSFNLVIEMLFFSRQRTYRNGKRIKIPFQSRNRDAFLFKSR